MLYDIITEHKGMNNQTKIKIDDKIFIKISHNVTFSG